MSSATIEAPVGTRAASSERRLTIAGAMNEALAQEMRRDPSVFIMGEDLATLGGVWAHTGGLLAEFGEERVRDCPISETAFIGAAVGAANLGMRPIVELMFVDFFGVCMDPIYNLAAKSNYHSRGTMRAPMVILTAVGGGYGDASQHSQCLYATFAHLPGLKVVIPSNAYDAKGLLTAAIRDDNPVVFMFHKNLQGVGWLGTVRGAIVDVPVQPYVVPLGQAAVVRAGRDITLVGLGATVHYAIDAAKALDSKGIDAEVIDLRSLAPLDRDTIIASARKTGRLVVVDDDYLSYGVSAEIIATVAEACTLLARPRRLAYPDIPVPFARPLEQFALPNAAKLVELVWSVMENAG
jgi:acetoin:2,6-dichlorophenolindophenol oxidoreductase subunit beta